MQQGAKASHLQCHACAAAKRQSLGSFLQLMPMPQICSFKHMPCSAVAIIGEQLADPMEPGAAGKAGHIKSWLPVFCITTAGDHNLPSSIFHT
eukprot:1138709-Pelagomonas_calceolata.AAC.9